jgi:hypothetical protein
MRVLVSMLVLTVAAPARAERLTMERVEAESLHLADQQGAINRRTDVTLAVDLGPKGRAEAIAKGTQAEHNLYVGPAGNTVTADTATWATVWRGTWARARATLTLDLALISHDCKATREQTGAPPEPRACQVPSPRAVLTCTRAPLDIAAPSGPPTRTTAWRCIGNQATALAETPSRWTLGTRHCIQVRGGHRSAESYGPCGPR